MIDVLKREEIENVLNMLSKRIIDSKGVKICMRQGSRNFENWVQVELCSILSDLLPGAFNRIQVEKHLSKKSSIDIVIFNNAECSEIQAGIEIKVIAMGGPGGSCARGIEKDMQSLRTNFDSNQKILLWVIYNKIGHKIEKPWNAYKPQEGSGIGPISVKTNGNDPYEMKLYAHIL